MLLKKYRSWKKDFESKKHYCTMAREPFYDIAAKYLPSAENAMIVDVGAGNGSFARHLDLARTYDNLFLLDGNKDTAEKLKGEFKNAAFYEAPDRLPFEDATVNYMHSSHMVEHLFPKELYGFIKEVDRVLSKDGIFVVSTPLFSEAFYGDLSHVKPYNPSVFDGYLSGKHNNRSSAMISERYEILELAYRYAVLNGNVSQGWGSVFPPIDLVIQVLKKILLKLGFRKYKRNGYTLVLKKT